MSKFGISLLLQVIAVICFVINTLLSNDSGILLPIGWGFLLSGWFYQRLGGKDMDAKWAHFIRINILSKLSPNSNFEIEKVKEGKIEPIDGKEIEKIIS